MGKKNNLNQAPRRRICSKPFLDNLTVIRLHRLFRIYKEIPLTHIALLYYKHYNELLDPVASGYGFGLEQFFPEKLSKMIHVVDCCHDMPVYALRQEADTPSNARAILTIPDRIRIIKIGARMTRLMDPQLPMWAEFKHLLEVDRSWLCINPSPLEIVLLKDETSAKSHIAKFHKVLSKHPEGVRADELCTKLEDLNESFELFGAADVCCITSECFELFHVREVDGKSIVFDGKTTTDDKLYVKNEESQALAARSILSGLYQKTLLLLSTTLGQGMKLGVWSVSIEMNFGQYDPVVQPLELLKAWRDEGLLDIREGAHFKNDLIVNIPKRDVDRKYTHATKEELIEMADEHHSKEQSSYRQVHKI